MAAELLPDGLSHFKLRPPVLSWFSRKVAGVVSVTRLLYRMAGPHRFLLLGALSLSLSTAFVEGGIMLVAVPLVTRLFGNASDLPAFYPAVDRWFPEAGGPSGQIAVSLGVLAASLLFKQILTATTETLNCMAASRIVTHVRARTSANLMRARFATLDRWKTGTPRQIIVSEATFVPPASKSLVDLLGATLTGLLALFLLDALSRPLTLGLCAVLLLVAPAKLGYSVLVQRARNEAVTTRLSLMDRLNEALLGIRQFKLANRNEEIVSVLREDSRIAESHRQRALTLQAWEPVLVQLALVLGLITVLVLNGGERLAPTEQIMAYIFLLYRSLPVTQRFNTALNSLLKSHPSLLQVATLFEMDENELEPAADSGEDVGEITSIDFRDVRFSYRNDRPALRGVTLSARAGEMIALVGGSGAGKSSVALLMHRAYQASGGDLNVNGRSIDAWSIESLRRTVSVVTQDIHLANTSIADVIRAGSTSLTREALLEAAREAEAIDFIEALPAGFDTTVGERGVRLSVGQRQRLLLAQVYAHRSSVVILDEATSALDQSTALRIMDNLKRHREGRIIIVISHRYDQLGDVDRVYVLDQGTIVESGSLAELQARDGALGRLSRADGDGGD